MGNRMSNEEYVRTCEYLIHLTSFVTIYFWYIFTTVGELANFTGTRIIFCWQIR